MTGGMHVDWANVIIAGLTLAIGLLGWVMRTFRDELREEQRKQRDNMHELRGCVSTLSNRLAAEYVKEDRFDTALARLETIVVRIEDKIDHRLDDIDRKMDAKADKSTCVAIHKSSGTLGAD